MKIQISEVLAMRWVLSVKVNVERLRILKKHMKLQISELFAMRWMLSVNVSLSVNAQDIKSGWKN